MASIFQFAEMKLDNDQIVYINAQYITSFRYDEEHRETLVDVLGEGNIRRAYPGNQMKEILQSLLYVNS